MDTARDDRQVGTPEERRARFERVAPELVEPLRRYLARRTDPATADDVLSDTLLVCWRRLDAMPERALPWAYGVARNCLANADRGGRRQRRLAARIAVVDPPREDVAGPGEHGDDDTRVADAMATLREEDSELLRLWAWEQLAPGEIADVLGVTTNAASIRLHRARGKLKEALRKQGTTAGHEESRERRRP